MKSFTKHELDFGDKFHNLHHEGEVRYSGQEQFEKSLLSRRSPAPARPVSPAGSPTSSLLLPASVA